MTHAKPSAFGAASFDEGNIVEFLRAGRLPAEFAAGDQLGLASAALSYPMRLDAGESGEIFIALPLHQGSSSRAPAELLSDTLEGWERKLSRVTIRLPQSAQRLIDTARSTVAYILINRDGASIQPGSRSYERSWIRDGSLTSAALLRMGHAEAVRQFLEWYAPYQYPNGKVPCCVDRRGADPVPEHDSHGQLIFLIAEYYRFTGDRELLERMWPHVVKAVEYIDSLRRQRMTKEYASGEKRAFYGLVPESISHEGYSAKPMHSYWDDFFILKGLKDATEIASVLASTCHPEPVRLASLAQGRLREGSLREEEIPHGDPSLRCAPLRMTRDQFAAMRDEFRRHLLDSFRLAMANHRFDYLPGSVELGDFDATSTTVGVAPAGEKANLPQTALERTFEKYYQDHVERVRRSNWEAYTPYEWRTVGTFIRLGQKKRAHEMVDFFFGHQRPSSWNHWAEVVFREQRMPKFIGDMPHTWVGSDFIRSFTDMLAYEQDDGSLVLGAGVVPEWVTNDPGVAVENLRTHYGTLNFTMRGDQRHVRVRIAGDARPPGGIVIHSPYDRRVKRVTPDGVIGSGGRTVRIRLSSLPTEVTLHY